MAEPENSEVSEKSCLGGGGTTAAGGVLGLVGGGGVGASIGATFLGPLGLMAGAKVGSTVGLALGAGAGAIVDATFGKLFTDRIFIKNQYKQDMAIALHYRKDKVWNTHAWVKVPAGETVKIAHIALDSTFIYVHAHCDDGATWGKGDYSEVITGAIRKFSQFDTGKSRGDYTIRLHA